jgi:chromosome segregation ATPase
LSGAYILSLQADVQREMETARAAVASLQQANDELTGETCHLERMRQSAATDADDAIDRLTSATDRISELEQQLTAATTATATAASETEAALSGEVTALQQQLQQQQQVQGTAGNRHNYITDADLLRRTERAELLLVSEHTKHYSIQSCLSSCEVIIVTFQADFCTR